jgi:hypothetical protein
MPAPLYGDADISDNDDRDDLSSLDLDASGSDDQEYFMPPSERLDNREEAEYQRFEDLLEYRNLKQLSTHPDADTDDESHPNHRNKKFISKYHSTVFPGLNIPVNANKKGKKSSQGVTQVSKEEVVPIMSVECPLPGGEAVTMVTDPVQRVSWGPLTRIEASKQARDVVKEWQKRSSTTKERNATKGTKDKESPSKVKTTTALPLADHDEDKKGDIATEEAANSTSQAETDFTNSRLRVLKPPPPTPPDAIFHSALSMPTLPNLHRISDATLVEQYRLQRALDPDAFDRQTRAIKRGLVNAKIARGGKDRLLKNEYTVELASREDAATAEKWATGRIVQMRSRGNTTSAPSTIASEKLGIRGGEIEVPPNTGKVVQAVEGRLDVLDKSHNEVSKPQDESQEIRRRESGDTTKNDEEGMKTKNSREMTPGNKKIPRQELKAKLNSFDLPSHVSKMTTSGTIRHQHSEKREISDYGEKRTVTTWIQIEEVYQVPASSSLSWKDVITAVKQEADGEEGGYVKGDKKRSKHKKNQAKHIPRSAVNRKQRNMKDNSSDSETGTRSSNTSVNTSGDHGQTRTEELFETLSRYGEVNEEVITRLTRSLGEVISELRGKDELTVEEED